MPALTASLPDDEAGDDRSPPGWSLVLVMDAAHPLERPLRVSLAGIDEVVIGRGAVRAVRRDGDRLLVELTDAAVSASHARLTRATGGWSFADDGSKNGVFVNGERSPGGPLGEDDLMEVGTTFFRLRPGAWDARPADWERRPPGLRTLSDSLRHAVELIARVAASPVPVLIHGATGTGKELAARAIHELSRRPGSFVAVSCGALPDGLIASELFGARKGAFTGALADRQGLVQAAGGGTLFLDEVAELSEPSQAVLLRVLQEREVVPLGATQPVRVDLRIVAATHEDLEARVAARRFRKDLYARLRGFVLELPPLRERPEDVGLLIAELLGRVAGERAGALSFARAAARALLVHDWPLNVRELEQTLGAAVAVAGGDEIKPGHLPEALREACTPDRAVAARAGARERFVTAVHAHGGNVSAIARALGTSRSQVRRLAERYAVDLDVLRR